MSDIPMSDEECRFAMQALESRIEAYAHLIVTRGVAVAGGQELVVTAPVEAASFTRDVVRAGYAAGASHVTVIWQDDQVTRAEYEHTAIDYFRTTPGWKREQLDSLAAAGACFLWLEGEDPDALRGIDPAKPAAAAHARNTECAIFRHGLDFGQNAWCIAGVPVPAWAAKVYPHLSHDEAILRLWRAILDVARVTDDPDEAWDTHNAAFQKSKRLLNEGRFDALHYTSGNGTNLTIGLPRNHVWEGGAASTAGGTSFFPNIPTEEVFTSPDRMRSEGTVFSAMPLVLQGTVIREFWFRFEAGRVVDFGAEQGAEVLRQLLDSDEGARRLGECALISKNTPIRQTGLLFYSTLYDENASCHLALGMGFPECYEGGCDLSPDELLERGVNRSSRHVDFMVGADDLSIMGITAAGDEVPVFVHGQWAWE